MWRYELKIDSSPMLYVKTWILRKKFIFNSRNNNQQANFGGTIVDENVILFSWALARNLLEGRDHVYFSWFGFHSDHTWVILRILQNQGRELIQECMILDRWICILHFTSNNNLIKCVVLGHLMILV
jgi:hypothetical protein